MGIAAFLAAVVPYTVLAASPAAPPSGAVQITDAALAQALPPPQPGRTRPQPEFQPAPNLDFSIQAPRRSPVPRAVEELSFHVKDVHITGATVYPRSELAKLTAAVVGKTIHLSDLISAAEKIEAKYRADGYVLTRAYVPTQSVSNGVFTIAVVEGFVAAVSVQGADDSTRKRVEALLAPVTASRPLKLPVLEGALLAANQLPGNSASGLLRPSASEPGASDLVVTVVPGPWTSSASLDNRGAAMTGRWTLSADTTFRSPFSDGGQIALNASGDPSDVNRRRAFQARYVAPVNLLDGMTFSMTGLLSHGEPAGAVSNLKMITNNAAVGPRVSVPLLLERQQKLSVEGGITYEQADVQALGGPLSHDEWRVADIGMSYQNSAWLDGVTNATFDASQGLPTLGASRSGSAGLSRPDGRTDFTKLTSSLGRVQPIAGPVSASLLISGQYSPVPLLTGEELSFGGAQIGRGYDPGSITGDTGVGGALELRYDLNASSLDLDSLQLYGFYDAGKVWSYGGPDANTTIASAGGGIRFGALSSIAVDLEGARALVPVPGNDDGHRTTRFLLNTTARF